MKAAILVYEGTEPIDLATYGVLSMDSFAFGLAEAGRLPLADAA